jgi:hypothetical protein
MVSSQNDKDLCFCYSLVGKQADKKKSAALGGTVNIDEFFKKQNYLQILISDCRASVAADINS